MIGTTRRFNEELQTVEWTRSASNHANKAPAPAKENVIFNTYPQKEASKLVFQIGTSDPDRAVQAARLVAGDVIGIDVNAGCPKPFSTTGGMGAALLRTPDKLCAILEALVKNITPEFEIGISVKIRVLETPEQTEALVRKLCATGITGLTVHCRTPAMRKQERAIREQLRLVVGICHEAGVACLVNGDVTGRDQGLQLAEEFGADGAMIALAAESNPSCFRTEADGGKVNWREVVENFMTTCLGTYNRFGNTKFTLSNLIPGKEPSYQHTIQCKNYTQLCKALEFEHLIDQAQEVDVKVGLDQAVQKVSKKGKANASARAAGGQMGKGKVKGEKVHRKTLSERKVTAPVEREQASVALTG